jgi:hypothetical protein
MKLSFVRMCLSKGKYADPQVPLTASASKSISLQLQELIMDSEAHASSLTEKLSAPVHKIVDKHKDKLSTMLAGHGALGKDENVRKVATFCYPLLPGLLRLVIKEHTFINFIMQNREKVLARLVPPAPLQQA